jgi:carboxypeptidase Q
VQSIAWTPALSSITARVVDVNEGSQSKFEKAGDIAGAIVLVHSDLVADFDGLMQEYFRSPAILQAALKGRAAAVAFTSTRPHDLLYRHMNVFTGRIDRIPQVLLAREDSLRIQRIIAHGERVRMTLSVPNQIGPPLKSQNVVAEWKGSGGTKEVVVLGAHLDSWELGTGALDNGCNAALVVDAVRAIRAAGRPMRTIRFILFSGEEQGMLGSLAYVRAHRSELDDIVVALIIDAGSGAITGFNTGGRKDIDAALQTALLPLVPWKATEITNDAGGGTDNADFQLEGVPTLVPNQEPADYLANYHASSDTFDKVDLKQLKINEAIVAQAILGIANLPTRLGVRQDRAQVQELLHEVHIDEELKALGLWQSWVDGTRGRQP